MSWWLILGAFGLVSLLSLSTLLLQCLGCIRPRFRWGEGAPMQVVYWGRGLVVPTVNTGVVLGRNTVPGLPANVLKRLPSVTLLATDSDSPEEECPVCQEPMSQQKVAVLPCKHSFHSPCLREWLCRKATCPTCRMTITESMITGDDVEAGLVSLPTALQADAVSLGPLPHEHALVSCRD